MVLLLTAGWLQVQAQTSQLKFRHGAGNLAKIAEDFGSQFKVQLAYVNEELTAIRVPAGNYEAPTVGELLNKVLAPANFKAIANGNSWIIRKSETPRQVLATMVLQGVIREGDNPVASATVIIKQAGQGSTIAVADEKGHFSKNSLYWKEPWKYQRLVTYP
ncbi:hypothetical protein [Paraflavitalea speifideaquila]|uniref:hypothetical protein n=1 Tax=Paraflavitalea speifideaquila TaxID=3076558 RepID=UPI0028E9926D|nr:hypothetical protein [Paraflavitalea speifideiaquila]